MWSFRQSKDFWNLAAVAWAAMLLGGALILEYGFGMAPCALCMTQRLFVLLAGVAAVAGLAHNPRLGIYPLMAVLATVAGAWSSIRHLYLLSLPADQVAGCGVDFDYMVAVFPIMDVLRAMLSGTGECAEQSWVVPGLALAGFVGMLILVVVYWRAPPDRPAI